MHLHLSLLAMPSFLICFMMSIFATKQRFPEEHKVLVFVLILLVLDFILGVFNIIAALKPASTLAAFMIEVTLGVSIAIYKKATH